MYHAHFNLKLELNMDSHKVQLLAASATTAAIAVGGMMMYKWIKHRHGNHNHSSNRFDDFNVWCGSHYGPDSAWEGLNVELKDSMKYHVRLAEICQKYKQVT